MKKVFSISENASTLRSGQIEYGFKLIIIIISLGLKAEEWKKITGRALAQKD
jgi:hypothetical protein